MRRFRIWQHKCGREILQGTTTPTDTAHHTKTTNNHNTITNNTTTNNNNNTSRQSVPPARSSAMVRCPGTVESKCPSSDPSPKLKNWFHRLWHLQKNEQGHLCLCVCVCECTRVYVPGWRTKRKIHHISCSIMSYYISSKQKIFLVNHGPPSREPDREEEPRAAKKKNASAT